MWRIRTIARMAGVREATLRAWERRYGFPTPLRGENNYRNYSAEELDAVREVARLIASGLSVSEAIAQVRARPLTSVKEIAGLHGKFWLAADLLDAEALDAVLAEAEQALPAAPLCETFLLPLLREMAERLDVAQEHLASALIRQYLRGLVSSIPVPLDGPKILLACPPRDTHEGGLLGLAVRLRLKGWRVTVLGADTPVEALRAAAEAAVPDWVGLSFVRQRERKDLRELLQEIVAACACPVVVGGPGIAAHGRLVEEVGAQLADSAEALVALQARRPKSGAA